MPVGYKGPRRKLLVVDNEPVDRELLLNILEPLGFEVREAASGAECLRIYPEFQPEIIFMDLAMPEMDGWETCHLIRNVHKSDVKIGIISANAFDKNLENSSGITDKDFILKPVNLFELINWIGERLNLQWIENKEELAIESVVSDYVLPSHEVMNDLLRMINMGYLVGVRKLINEIDEQQLACPQFVAELRQMSEKFQLGTMKTFIEEKLADV
jgi:CheY-like chemotaxis protein